jgi:hypothetical protein
MKKHPLHLIYASLIFLGAVWAYQFVFRFGAAGFVLPNDGIRWASHLRGILMILGGSIGISLLAEWMGYALSKWLKEDPAAAKQFTFMWARGVIVYFLVTYLCAIALLRAGRTDSSTAPFLAAIGLMIVLLLLRKTLHWIIVGRRSWSAEKVPGQFIGALIAVVWNLMGMYMVDMFHEQTSFFSGAGLVLIGFGMAIPVAIGYLLFALLEAVLSKTGNPIAKWNTSGTILYLSWFCFGFIARLAPSTLGRPEKWAGLLVEPPSANLET